MITIITTCKGRLAHLKDLVASLQRQTCQDFVHYTVDYNCPDNCGDWVRYLNDKKFNAIRFRPQSNTFNLSKGRNFGVEHLPTLAIGRWLLFLDADTILDADFLERIERLDPQTFYTGEPYCSGNCLVFSDSFNRIKGYDEDFNGWGAEDADLYIRLQNQCMLTKLRLEGMHYQNHSDVERTQFYEKKIRDSQKENIKLLLKKYPLYWIVPQYISETDIKLFQ